MLTAAVPIQNFEKIRDRIAEILALEIPSQAALQGRADIDAEVYTSRMAPFDHTDLPCINVEFTRGDYPSRNSEKSDGTYLYHIDVFTKKPTTSSLEGGQASSEVSQRIAGTVRAILSNPIYRTLNFAAPSLKHTEVNKIMIPEYLELEAVNYRLVRVVFSVDTIEGIEYATPVPFGEALSSVSVDCTDNGFLYKILATP